MEIEYQQTIEELFTQAPSYQVIGGAAYHPGMKVMKDFNDFLGGPSNDYKIIHVGGTNGKGSVSSMLCSVLMEAGYKVGLYTSPHLLDFRERIKIDGEMITKEDVVKFWGIVKLFVDQNNPSFFEITTAMALWYFRKMGADIVLLEVGLGGRLDSTNIVLPILSIITSIGLDHCDLLGDTEEEIAREKAGIMKAGVPMVVGNVSESVRRVLVGEAERVGVELILSQGGGNTIDDDACFDDSKVDLSRMDLKGEYQKFNLNTFFSAVIKLKEIAVIEDGFINSDRFLDALYNTANRTKFRGRWERLSSTPDIICDIAHNEAGIRNTMSQLLDLYERDSYKRLVIIIGMVSNKDIDAVARLLPLNADYIFTQAKGTRALPVNKLADLMSRYGLKGICASSVAEAMEVYNSISRQSDLVYIGGSSFVVAEALELK